MKFRHYIREQEFDVFSSSRKSVKELCEGKDERKIQKVAAEEQAKRSANRHVDKCATGIMQFKKQEIDAASLTDVVKREKDAYLKDVEGLRSHLTQFEIGLIWNNAIKRMRDNI